MRRCLINNIDFTIISNNCWAGYVYRYFGLEYKTPTIGTYFFADDYIKFIKDLKHYISCDIIIIPAEKSKYYNYLKKNNQRNVPIGKLDDIEIVFLHYNTPQEAKEKWNRRKERINWDNIIIKFSEMNNCSEDNLIEFDNIDNVKKFMFISNKNKNYKSAIYFKGYEKENQILNDTFYWKKYINIIKLINSKPIKYPSN